VLRQVLDRRYSFLGNPEKPTHLQAASDITPDELGECLRLGFDRIAASLNYPIYTTDATLDKYFNTFHRKDLRSHPAT
jgi:hypothetical protein